eukprot:231252-Rhodomonas_salina.1
MERLGWVCIRGGGGGRCLAEQQQAEGDWLYPEAVRADPEFAAYEKALTILEVLTMVDNERKQLKARRALAPQRPWTQPLGREEEESDSA